MGYIPINQTSLPRYDMSTRPKDLSITINGYIVNEVTHVNAGIKARGEITEKIRVNQSEIYLTSDGHSTTVKQVVELAEDTDFDSYLQLLETSRSR